MRCAVVAILVALTVDAAAKPLPAGMTSTVKDHVPHIQTRGVDVAIGDSVLVPFAMSKAKVELSADGASLVVSYRGCDDPADTTLSIPLVTVEAKVENTLGMQLHLKKDYAGAIAHFKIAAAKDPMTALYATNLLSAQSMARDLAGADATLAAYGPKNAPWFAWRLDADDELANVRRRPNALALAAPKPGHAVAVEGSYAYSPYGGGLIAAVVSGAAMGVPEAHSSLSDLVLVERATGRELLRLSIQSMADECMVDCTTDAVGRNAARRKAGDRVLARLGFEKVGDWMTLAANKPVKSPDGVVLEGGEKLHATVGGQRYEYQVNARTVGVVPSSVVILMDHSACEGTKLAQTLATASIPAVTAQAPTRPEVNCDKLARPLIKDLKKNEADLKADDVACAAGRFGEPGVFVLARGHNAHEYVYRYAVVRANGSPILKPYDEPMSSQLMEDSTPDLDTSDLDGDGFDEIIETHATDRHAIGSRLLVLHLDHGKFVETIGPWISLDDSGFEANPPTICEGTMAVEPARVVITVTRATDSSKQCLAKGRHAFVLRAGKLVEAH